MKNLHYNVRTTEIGDVANRLARLYKGASTLQDDAFLKATFTELETQGEGITEAVKKSKVVSQLEEADAQRDEAIRVLGKVLKGYEAIPLANLQTHGEKLNMIFKKYGVKMVDENYSSQSNLVESLLKELSANEVQTSVAALSGVAESIAKIREAQDNFAKLRSEYEKAMAQSETEQTASSLRKPLLELINKKLIPYLVAMQIAQSERYKAFTQEASQIIESMNEVVKARAKKDKTTKNEDTTQRN